MYERVLNFHGQLYSFANFVHLLVQQILSKHKLFLYTLYRNDTYSVNYNVCGVFSKANKFSLVWSHYDWSTVLAAAGQTEQSSPNRPFSQSANFHMLHEIWLAREKCPANQISCDIIFSAFDTIIKRSIEPVLISDMCWF